MTNRLRHFHFVLWVAVLGSVLMASQVGAAQITFTASGTVDFVDPALSGTFAPGQSFAMTYTFESTTPPRAGSDSTVAVFDAMVSQSFTLDSYSGSATGAEEIQIDNDPPFPFNDRYSPGPGAGSTIIGANVDGLSLASFYFRLDDSTNTAFSDALILPTSLSLSSFTSATFSVDFLDINNEVHSVTGTITSLVPEPTSLVLGLLGACGVAMVYRRKTK